MPKNSLSKQVDDMAAALKMALTAPSALTPKHNQEADDMGSALRMALTAPSPVHPAPPTTLPQPMPQPAAPAQEPPLTSEQLRLLLLGAQNAGR